MPLPAATQAAARLWTAHPELHTDPLATKLAECMTPPAGSVRRFTRGCVQELKNGHNSVTVQNRTHVYMNFFHHKDLGNHLLQLCPKVVKHPVYPSRPPVKELFLQVPLTELPWRENPLLLSLKLPSKWTYLPGPPTGPLWREMPISRSLFYTSLRALGGWSLLKKQNLTW